MNHTLRQAIGQSRHEHEAIIANAGKMWQGYAEKTHEGFVKNQLKKYVALNSEGQVVERYLEPPKRGELHTNATTLRHEDFLTIRDVITQIRERELTGIADLEAAGLVFPVSIGEQLVGFENVNDFPEAKQEMNPRNGYQNNDTVFGEDYVPNPITHQSFEVPWRQQGYDYKRSQGLDRATRSVTERIQKTLIEGNSDIAVTFQGTQYPIYGYTNHPDRGTGTISNWAASGTTGTTIVNELIEQLGNMWNGQGGVRNDRVMVYVANNIWTKLQEDHKADGTATILERMRRVAYVMEVKPLELLGDSEVVLVEMERRTIEVAKASDIIAVPHQMTHPFAPMTMTIYGAMVQFIRSDQNQNTGVRHLTT